MKFFLLILALSFFSANTFGQTEKIDSKAIADNFEKKYNAGNYEAIFSMFGTEMQDVLPIDKTQAFLKRLKSEAGQIVKRQFVKYVKGNYASYKTNFERALFAVNISIDKNSKITGLFVIPFKDDNLPKMDRNLTKLILPFKGEWSVMWGGDTEELNYHVESVAQKNAFDFLIKNRKGITYKTSGETNEDYFAFGKELFAPCDGEVVLVVDGVKDNIPGDLNPYYNPGNSVIIKTAKNEYLFFAHFKQYSIKVEEGQKVTQGELLGLCGNSGNSSEPHLHFHIQNVENMNIATGVKCYFDRLLVNGQPATDYSPIRKDKIKSN